MTKLRAGAVLISAWSGLNLLVGAAVTAMTLAGRRAPALLLVFPEEELARLDPKLVAVVNAQAALANPCIVALCGLVLAIVWTSLAAGRRWVLVALTAALIPLQAFGFVSDGFLGHQNLVANLVSTVLLLAGLGLAAAGLPAARLTATGRASC